MCELNLVKPSPLSSSVKPSILHSCMNDLTLSDRARLRARHLCSISLAAVMDDHQAFWVLLLDLDRGYNLSGSSLNYHHSHVSAIQHSNAIKVIERSPWLPWNYLPGTTPCLRCHSNSVVDLGGVWGLLLVEVEGCIKNDGCSVNDQFSSLIVALLFSFLLSPFLNIFPSPLPSLFLCLSLPVPLLCPWRELIQIVSWSLLLLLLLLSNLPLLPLILCHHLRFTPPFSLLTGSRRQPCLVLDEWELCVNHFCVQKRMWRVVCMCERKTSFHLCSRFSESVCVCVYLLKILCV